ncbi:MAG: hypothetical protein ACRCV6_05230 [Formosimonas sp.]
MNELDYLRSMWAAKVKRGTKLIVPKITYIKQNGSLNNNEWAFNVPYAFRDSLDIKYEERKKDKKPYMIWTQGTVLNFKEGDFLQSKDFTRALQVQFSSPMGWDSSKGEMYQGSVLYLEYALLGL